MRETEYQEQVWLSLAGFDLADLGGRNTALRTQSMLAKAETLS
jgi:hypothetical protein